MSEQVTESWGELFLLSIVVMVVIPLIGGAVAIVCLVAFLHDKPMMAFRAINKWLGVAK